MERLPSAMWLESTPPKWLEKGKLKSATGVVTAATQSDFIERFAGGLRWRQGEKSVTLPNDLARPRIAATGAFVVALRGNSLEKYDRDGKATLLYAADGSVIDSFDIDPKGQEVVFSASRSGNYDVAVISSEGGEPKWIAPDPRDERMVRWAPRGNKVSYVMRTFGATAIRTVHLPTSYQLTASLPFTDVTDLQWDPRAERYAVIASTPTRSPHVLTMKYSGEDQKSVTTPLELNAEIDQLPGRSEVVLLPQHVRYGSRYPVVVLAEELDPFAWSDTAAAILKKREVIIVRTSTGTLPNMKEIRDSLATMSLVDASKIVTVAAGNTGGADVVADGSPAKTAAAVIAALQRLM
jgi:hypothetical protein